MSEMLDKVSEAIREKIGTRHRGLPKGGWDGLMKMAARAAIEAMQEPTADIVAANVATLYDLDGEVSKHYLAEAIWRSGIAAALSRS